VGALRCAYAAGTSSTKLMHMTSQAPCKRLISILAMKWVAAPLPGGEAGRRLRQRQGARACEKITNG
jgi:hypothetical protein